MRVQTGFLALTDATYKHGRITVPVNGAKRLQQSLKRQNIRIQGFKNHITHILYGWKRCSHLYFILICVISMCKHIISCPEASTDKGSALVLKLSPQQRILNSSEIYFNIFLIVGPGQTLKTPSSLDKIITT